MSGRASEAQIERRRAIVAAIIGGAPYVTIAREWGIGVKGAQHYTQYLSPAELRQRKALERQRGHGDIPCRGSNQRRDAIVSAILAGDRFADIGARFGIGESGVRGYLRHLSTEQRARRKALSTPSAPFRPHADELYARIAAAIPYWLSAASREDAISDLYLAILQGQVAVADVPTVAARYARRTASVYENRFGPRSLDEKVFDDGDVTLGATLIDPAALDAFDHIFEEAL